MERMYLLKNCTLCPRKCGAARLDNQTGFAAVEKIYARRARRCTTGKNPVFPGKMVRVPCFLHTAP